MNPITDITFLKILSKKDNYERYLNFVDTSLLPTELQLIIKNYGLFYKEFKKDIVLKDFIGWFFHRACPHLKENQLSVYNTIFNSVENADDAIVEDVITHFKELDTATKLRNILDTKFDRGSIDTLFKEHDDKIKSLRCLEGWIPNDLDSIAESTSRKGGLHFRLDCLSKSLNALIKGDFGIVAGYVDTGKSTLCVSEAAYMAQQVTDGCVLWLNNEEYNTRVLKRIWQAVLRAPWSKIIEDKDRATQLYLQKMHDDIERIKFIDIRGKTIPEIKDLFKASNPKLAIVDQIDKIQTHTKKHWGEHDRLKSLYGDMRSLASEYCPIIAVSQADASSRYLDKKTQEVVYQRYLDQSQLDGSKIGKPGEADFIITVGRDLDYPNSRYIHTPKNKMDGIDENCRHIKAEVVFNGECSLYENPR